MMWKYYLKERETDRLIIRPLVIEDSPAWREFIMDELATSFLPGEWKLEPEKSEEWINLQLKRYREKRYGLQALIEKKSGKLIGQCGLLSQTVDGREEMEIGYHLIPRYWGNGYASEAAVKFKEIGFEKDISESIISIIDTKNIPSQKVALRNGMTRETRTKYLDMEVYIYRITRAEYMRGVPHPW